MSSSEPDDALELAIAMSLQRSPRVVSQQGNNATIDLTIASSDDEEDEDLKQAIALSLQEPRQPTDNRAPLVSARFSSKHTSLAVSDYDGPETSTSMDENTSSSGNVGMMGLDRKAMEDARLARLGKRKRDVSPQRPSKHAVDRLRAFSSTEDSNSKSYPSFACQYPLGTIKRTFAMRFPRTNDIRIDELLEADSLNIAVLSSFMWDADWLHTKLNPTKTKQIWVMNAKGRDIQQQWEQDMKASGVPNLKLHFPPMDGLIHSMHSKYMLLFSKHKLRIVVPTANMTRTDWGEVANDWQPGVMENTVFLIDLPRRADGRAGSVDSLSKFGRELVHFLERQKIPQNVIDGVLKFDFSHTGHIAFVHSIGGVHDSASAHPTALPGLARAIVDLELHDVQSIELDYASSSIGSLNNTLLRRIYLAARGRQFTLDASNADARKNIRIYFPTMATVENSIGGPDCGGIITLTKQAYEAATFPQDCLRDYDSTRRGMLSHNKLLFARGRACNGKPFAWVYVGSANLSESAWGGQKILKSGKMGSLNIRNWECGVVIPVPSDKFTHVEFDEQGIPSMDVFKEMIEVPFHYPGQKYGDKQPWHFKLR
ncbi:hypothetical protein ACN47E_001864 [Coniothyrium glycines]